MEPSALLLWLFWQEPNIFSLEREGASNHRLSDTENETPVLYVGPLHLSAWGRAHGAIPTREVISVTHDVHLGASEVCSAFSTWSYQALIKGQSDRSSSAPQPHWIS